MPGRALTAAREAVRLVDLDPDRGRPAAAEAVRLARRDGDPAAAALAEQAFGHSLMQCAEVDAAIRHLRRAVRHGESAGTWDVVAGARMKLAFAMVQRGRLAAAVREVDAAVAILDGTGDAAVARAQRAVILYQAGQLADAFAEYQAAIPLLRRADDPLNLQKALVNRGILHAERHEFDAALADLTEADRLARRLGRDLVVGIIAENLGFAETLRGDVPAALAHLERAERVIGEHHGQVAPVLQDRGDLLLSVGLVSEAREAAERAVVAFRGEHRQLKVPEVRLLSAQAAFLEGDAARARREAGLAAREFRRQRRPGWTELAELVAVRARLASGDTAGVGLRRVRVIADLLGRHGWPAAALEARLAAARLAVLRGQRDTAREYLRAASAARRRGPAALRARAWYAEALLRDDAGDSRGAAVATKAGLRILDEHAAALGATDLRVHSAAHRRDLTELGLRAAVRTGSAARIFEWAERGRARTLLFRPVRPPDDPVLAELLVRVREAAHGPPARLAALERQVRDHCRMHGDGTGAARPDPVSLSSLRATLSGRALVQYVQWDGVLHALTLTAGRLRWHPLGGVTDVTALLERVPFALQRMARHGGRAGSRAAATTLLHATAAGLDELLLRPLPELGDRPLVVVPTGPLHSLPWSVLPSCAGRPVSVAPSATSWHEAATRERAEHDGVLVAAGPGLAGGPAEAAEVAALHGTMPLAHATTTAVLDGLAEAGLAHLAAHGTLSAQNPLFSSLLLADGPLVGYDLERLPRLPDTVVLAACDSGRSVVLAGDELLGLGVTFLGRGTASLVASVVPVPDAQTRPLMVALHRALTEGRCPAEALAAAQRAVPGDDPAAVAAAAGFVCLGR